MITNIKIIVVITVIINDVIIDVTELHAAPPVVQTAQSHTATSTC